MIKNIKRSLIITVLIFITSYSLSSQTIIFNSILNDTTFCLTRPQAKLLIDRYYKSQEFQLTNNIKDTIIKLQDSTIFYLQQKSKLLQTNLLQTNNAKLYVQDQLAIKEEQVIKVEKKNNFLKTALKITIPIIIGESLIIYLQNK